MKTICYSLKSLTQVEKTRLQRELRGFTDRSNHGAYRYQRKGLLDVVKHRTVYFTGLVVDDKNAKKVISILRKHGAGIHVTNATKVP